MGSVSVDVVPDARGFSEKLNAALRNQNVKVGLDLDDRGFRQRLEAVTRGVSTRISVDLDDRVAAARLAELSRSRSTTINADVDTGAAASKLAALSAAAEGGGGSIRGLIVAGLAIAPAIVPAAGAAAAAIASIGTGAVAATAGVGVLVAGLAPVIKSVVEQTKATSAATTATTGLRQASEGVAAAQAAGASAARRAAQAVVDAQRGVADARRSAAQAVSSAIQQEEQAERRLSDALKTEKRAQEDLTQARFDAKRALEDLNNAAVDGALASRQAAIDLAKAKSDLDVLQAAAASTDPRIAKPSDSQLQAAQLAFEQAQQAQKEADLKASRSAADAAAANKAGVEGSKQVVDAKRNLSDARQGVDDARQGVDQAQAAVYQARVDGARRVADAERAVTEAQIAQREQAESTARSVKAAQDRMVSANRTLAASTQATDGLTKPGRELADLITKSLIPGFQRLSRLGQAPIAQGILDGLRAATPLLPVLDDLFTNLGRALGDVFENVGKALGSPFWVNFFDLVATKGGDAIRGLSDFLGDIITGVPGIFTAFQPAGKVVGDILLNLSQRFEDFGTGKTDGLQKFLEYAERVGPKVADFIGAAAGAVGHLAEALAPIGEGILTGLTDFFRYIAGIDPSKLGAVVGAVVGVIAAFKGASVIAGVVRGIAGAVAILGGGPLAVVVGTLALLAGGLFLAYQRSQRFRDIVRQLGDFLRRNVLPIFKDLGDFLRVSLLPALERLGGQVMDGIVAAFEGVSASIQRNGPQISQVVDVIVGSFKAFWAFVSKFVIPIIGALIEGGFRQIGGAIGAAIDYIGLLVRAFNAVVRAGRSLYRSVRDVWANIRDSIGDALGSIRRRVSGGIDFVRQKVRDGLNAIRDKFNDIWGKVKNATDDLLGDKGSVRRIFRAGVDAIGQIWAGLQDLAKKPVRFIIDTVINQGLIGAYSWVRGFIPGLPEIKPVPLPKGFRRGGSTGDIDPDEIAGVVHGNEHVATAEEVKATPGGHSTWERMRLAIRNGQTDFLHNLPGYRRGGEVNGGGATIDNPDARVTVNGKLLSKIAALQIALASQVSGIKMSVMQGGFGGSHVAASGTSHNWPGVADVSPGSIAVEKALRQVGFAAWARNIRGRSSVGSGAHVHAVSLVDPGNKGQGQIGSWNRGENGLNGGKDPAPHYSWIPNLLERLGATNLNVLAGSGGGGPDFLGFVKKLEERFAKPLEQAKSLAGSAFGDMSIGVAKKIATGLLDKVKDTAKNLVGSVIGGVGGGGTNREKGKRLMLAAGFGEGQFDPLNKLWTRESGWRTTAKNPSSGAYGIPQALPGSKMASVASDWRSNPDTQIKWGLGYIKARYGDPAGAWAHSQRTGWYDQGGWLQPGTTVVHNATGKPEPVLNQDQWKWLKAAANGGSRPTLQVGEVNGLSADDVAEKLFTLIERKNALHPVW